MRRPTAQAQDSGGAKPRRSASDKALALLARREHSRAELRMRLARDGYPEADIDAALASLAAANYQSDARFVDMLVRSRIAQGYGPLRLRAELRTHELTDEVVNAGLEHAEVDWTEQARAQLHRRYGDEPPADHRERAKRMQFLARRGFDSATVYAVVRPASS